MQMNPVKTNNLFVEFTILNLTNVLTSNCGVSRLLHPLLLGSGFEKLVGSPIDTRSAGTSDKIKI